MLSESLEDCERYFIVEVFWPDF